MPSINIKIFVEVGLNKCRNEYIKKLYKQIPFDKPICHITMYPKFQISSEHADVRHISLWTLLANSKKSEISVTDNFQKFMKTAVSQTNNLKGICIFEGWDEHIPSQYLIRDLIKDSASWIIFSQMYGKHSPEYLHNIVNQADLFRAHLKMSQSEKKAQKA